MGPYIRFLGERLDLQCLSSDHNGEEMSANKLLGNLNCKNTHVYTRSYPSIGLLPVKGKQELLHDTRSNLPLFRADIHVLFMYQSNRSFNIPPHPPPPGIPRAFEAFSCPGGREFDHHSSGVGNLIASLDVML